MINNERQYRITKAQLSKLQEAVKAFNIEEAVKRTGSDVLARAELEAMKSEEEILSEQLWEYDALQSGAIKVLKAEDLSELPSILIRARIAQGLSQRQLADMLDIKEQQIQRYESEEYASTSLRRLAKIADVLELNISEVAEIRQEPSDERLIKQKSIDWSQFPIKEMYRRHWFEGFSGSIEVAIVEAESLIKAFIYNVIRKPSVALHRKRVRAGSDLDIYALLAWECRIRTLVKNTTKKATYIHGSLDNEWITKLVKQSRYPDGPVRARKCLGEVGICLVIEPHLPNTHLDGVALLYGEMPVIGLTLRYDRLDNFWFVLFHELFHVIKHLRKGQIENIFDDLEAEPDELEREADQLAQKSLIPDEVWKTALARYVRSETSVTSLAEKLEISPTIIAGRIRNEANNYVILNELVGQGEVRKRFPEVSFGQ